MKSLKITILSAALSFSSVYAAAVTVPNTFTAGTPAKAADVNANFTALANAINSSAGDITALQSAMATAGFNYRNTWSSSTTYAKNDVVTNAGSSYVALRATTNNNPTIDVSNNGGNWGLIAQAGATGATGATGPVGPTGPKGDTGSTGAAGVAGPVGPKGDTGIQGLQGIQGPQGIKGDTGSQGSQGLQGPKGDTGATGPGALMVYDSTGKVVGRYFTMTPYGQTAGYNFVLIDAGSFTFAVSFFTNYGYEPPLFSWGDYSYFVDNYGYTSNDCSGLGYLMPVSINSDPLMNFAEVRDRGSNQMATIGSKDRQLLFVNSIAVYQGLGQYRCETGVGAAGRYWVSPVLGSFDLSVFTPPFSVH